MICCLAWMMRLIPAGAGSTVSVFLGGRPGQAHPRWRGEHVRMPVTSRICWWLIPAGAGSTHQRTSPPIGTGAHPRWRGEHADLILPGISCTGSSPLARGAPVKFIIDHWEQRLIPAGAGSTAPTQSTTPSPQAHPRWRGEHFGVGPSFQPTGGSSPLARGARVVRRHCLSILGLIPAGAGSTP